MSDIGYWRERSKRSDFASAAATRPGRGVKEGHAKAAVSEPCPRTLHPNRGVKEGHAKAAVSEATRWYELGSLRSPPSLSPSP